MRITLPSGKAEKNFCYFPKLGRQPPPCMVLSGFRLATVPTHSIPHLSVFVKHNQKILLCLLTKQDSYGNIITESTDDGCLPLVIKK